MPYADGVEIERTSGSSVADHEFRLMVQDNVPLTWADGYLPGGVTECICPPLCPHADCGYGECSWLQGGINGACDTHGNGEGRCQ